MKMKNGLRWKASLVDANIRTVQPHQRPEHSPQQEEVHDLNSDRYGCTCIKDSTTDYREKVARNRQISQYQINTLPAQANR